MSNLVLMYRRERDKAKRRHAALMQEVIKEYQQSLASDADKNKSKRASAKRGGVKGNSARKGVVQ